MLLLLAGRPRLAHACGPVAGGSTSCEAGQVASQGNTSGTNNGAGNPINVITGNKYQREEDMPALPGVFGLEIVRHYNSAYSGERLPVGALGRGWKLSYETELVEAAGKVQILQADGSRILFDRDPAHPSLCSSANPANGSLALRRQSDGRTEYDWSWTDGRILHFNSAGRLETIRAPTGETVQLRYDAHQRLVRVTDPDNRSLSLIYPDKGTAAYASAATHIDSPVGRFSYEYGSAAPASGELINQVVRRANLIRVRLPTSYDASAKAHAYANRGTTVSTVSRLYHYEDSRFPTLLTGISIETMGADGKPVQSRYATFGYDMNGRANLSTHAGNVDKVTLATPVGGQTILTNSLGQQTTYRHAIIGGEHRLLEARGAGCALCGPVNVRYQYDRLGRLTEAIALDSNGQALTSTHYELDRLGRTVEVGTRNWQGGKAQPGQWRTRYEYLGTSFAPSAIVRPSVVPGRQARIEIVYNRQGQPLEVTERGWTPSLGNIPAAPLERTTHYRYADFNGRSLLTRIDGPLANGPDNSPADSDVTAFEYDDRPDTTPAMAGSTQSGQLTQYDERPGRLTRVIAPGGLVTEILERDHALRPARLRIINGDARQLISIDSNWRSQPEQIVLEAGSQRRTMRYTYHVDGQIAQISLPGNLSSGFHYDAAGRLSERILPDGSRIALQYDTEGHTREVRRHLDADPAIQNALAIVRYDYDHEPQRPGRLTAMQDALGPIASYQYNEFGQIKAIGNALGITTRLDYDGDGLPRTREQAAGSVDAAITELAYDSAGRATRITAANGVVTERRYDDFGRKVFEADPDHGIALLRYDVADHLIARADETGSITRYTYDGAHRRLTMGADNQANLVRYRYDGSRLAEVIATPDGDPRHAIERTQYEHDAWGQVAVETRWLARVDQPEAVTAAQFKAGPVAGLTFVTRNDYDEAGRLVVQTLPDGHQLRYRYARVGESGARAGQLTTVLFDDQVVVRDIEQSVAGGLTGFVNGNGVRQHIAQDGRGRITQLQTMATDQAQWLVRRWWHRLLAWSGLGAAPSERVLYRQTNHYDGADRLRAIERSASGSNADMRYDYDRLDRLTDTETGGVSTRFSYDRGGNRIAEKVMPAVQQAYTGLDGAASSQSAELSRTYRYAPGSNRLIARDQSAYGVSAPAIAPRTPADAAELIRTLWFYHASGVPLAQIAIGADSTSLSRRIVYNSARRPLVVFDAANQPLARYYYDCLGQRIAKTIYHPRQRADGMRQTALMGAPEAGLTRYSLYRGQRLAAEADADGRILAHYLYLNGKPVAKIAMQGNRGFAHRLLVALQPADSDRLAVQGEADAGATTGHIFAIHTDHLGAPQLVTDAHQTVVWQADTDAFGAARIRHAALDERDGKPFEMNLRLPGQVFDVETGLHYNYLRDYDPALGRYVTPDPLGLAGGMNPYAYADNNPLGNIDPLGLYEEDIHYYMTYFLALAAGVDPRRAYIIATAAQYVDDNPATAPMAPTLIGSLWVIATDNAGQRDRLAKYHFTQGLNDDWTYDPATRYLMNEKPENAQLKRLLTAANYARRVGGTCAGDVMFGEYLHAFEDTFGHRDADNSPIQINSGFGHAPSLHQPDHTYNSDLRVTNSETGEMLSGEDWKYNEARALEMEHEVFDKFASRADGKSPVQSWETLEPILKEFNAIKENSDEVVGGTNHFKSSSKKIDLLSFQLNNFKYKFVAFDNVPAELDLSKKGQGQYDPKLGAANRSELLIYKRNGDGHKAGDPFQKTDPKFDGIILP